MNETRLQFMQIILFLISKQQTQQQIIISG